MKSHSGKNPSAPDATIEMQLNDMIRSRKIKYGEDDLLTMKSVTYLKNYFKADGVVHNGRSTPSHSADHAGKMTDVEMVESLIRTNDTAARSKESCTQFANERQQWTAAVELMTHQSRKWMNEHAKSEETNFQYMCESESLRKTYETCPEMRPNGWALAGGFVCRCSTGSFVSIATTKDPDNPMGFSIQTVYPGIAYPPGADEAEDTFQKTKVPGISDIRRQYMELTCEDATDIVRQTDTFKKADPIKKTRLLVQARPDLFYGAGSFTGNTLTEQNTSVTKVKAHGDKKGFNVYCADKTDKEGVYKISVSEDDVFMQRMKRDENGNYTPMLIKTNNGNMVKNIGTARDTVKYIENSLPDMYKILQTVNGYVQETKPAARKVPEVDRAKTVDADLSIETTDTTEASQNICIGV